MLMSNSFHEHAITVPPTRYESAYTISIGDIEIVNWQRARSLEEIEAELPDSFEQKLASKYVRSVLREKTSQRPDLDKLRECSGQLKLATVLEFSQYNRSDSLGVRPPLY